MLGGRVCVGGIVVQNGRGTLVLGRQVVSRAVSGEGSLSYYVCFLCFLCGEGLGVRSYFYRYLQRSRDYRCYLFLLLSLVNDVSHGPYGGRRPYYSCCGAFRVFSQLLWFFG